MDYAQLYPFLAISARGQFGHMWIHKQYRERFWHDSIDYPPSIFRETMAGNQGRVITKMYYPYNPRSVRQQANRAVFANGLYQWSYFSQSTKHYYDELKIPHYAYGIHRYMQMYLRANLP